MTKHPLLGLENFVLVEYFLCLQSSSQADVEKPVVTIATQ